MSFSRSLAARSVVAGLLVSLLVVVALLVVLRALGNDQQAAREARRTAAVIASDNRVEKLVIDLQTAERGFVLTGSDDSLKTWNGARAALPVELLRLHRLVRDPAQEVLANEIVRDVRGYVEHWSKPQVAIARVDRERAAERTVRGGGKLRVDDLRKHFSDFSARQQAITDDATERATATGDRARTVAIAAAGGFGALILLYVCYLTQAVLLPIRRIAAAADRLARGDLSARVAIRGRHELAELGRSFNTMTDSLQSERERLAEAITRLAREHGDTELYSEFGDQLAAETGLAAIAETILRTLADEAAAEVGALYVATDPDETRMSLSATRGLPSRLLSEQLDLGVGLAGRALAERRIVQASHGGTGLPLFSFGARLVVRHELHLPLIYGDRLVGALSFGRTSEDTFSASDVRALERLSERASVALASALSTREVRRLADLNRAVLDAARDGMVLLDGDQRPVLVNATADRIYTETIGVSAREALSLAPEAIGAYMKDPTAYVATSEAISVEPDGETRDEFELRDSGRCFERITAPVRDAAGDPIGRIEVVREVTGERQAERVKNELMATVSHELRTPLASVVGFTELLRERELDEPTRRVYVDTIHRESGRLSALIDDLLDLQRMERRGVELARDHFDMGGLIAEQVGLYSAQSTAHELAVELPPTPLMVFGDRDRLAQVLGNLLSNAIKYSPDGGRVTAEACCESDRVTVSITDEGLGIARGQQEHVFDRFYRVDRSDEHQIGGTGLGLAIVREIVEAHGGRVGLEDAPGRGSRFWFEVPAAAADGAPGFEVRRGRVPRSP